MWEEANYRLKTTTCEPRPFLKRYLSTVINRMGHKIGVHGRPKFKNCHDFISCTLPYNLAHTITLFDVGTCIISNNVVPLSHTYITCSMNGSYGHRCISSMFSFR